jgi:hypothetical protein
MSPTPDLVALDSDWTDREAYLDWLADRLESPVCPVRESGG